MQPGRREQDRGPGRILAILVTVGLLFSVLPSRAQAAPTQPFGQIAMVQQDGIVLVDTSGVEVQRLADGSGLFGPSWSPSGRRFSYSDGDRVHIVDLWTGEKTTALDDHNWVENPLWFDENRVGYASSGWFGGSSEIHVYNVADGTSVSHAITTPESEGSRFGHRFSVEGYLGGDHALLMDDGSGETTPWRVNITTGAAERISLPNGSTSLQWDASVNPVNGRVLYVATDTRDHRLLVASPGEPAAVLSAPGGSLSMSRHSWSADGRFLVVSRTTADQSSLDVYDDSGDLATTVPLEGGSPAWRPMPTWAISASGRYPVVIVPGAMGSFNTSALLKPTPSADPAPNEPTWDPTKNRFGPAHGWRLDPVKHTYDNLIRMLEGNGYEVDKDNLFFAPYDWRRPNRDSARDHLAPVIRQAAAKSRETGGDGKVVLLAHSMGGLVSRAYIDSDEYADDVAALIMLGTPNRGSGDAYWPTEGGRPYPGATGSALPDSLREFTAQCILITLADHYQLQHDLSEGELDAIVEKALANRLPITHAVAEALDQDAHLAVRRYCPSTVELMPEYDYLTQDLATISRRASEMHVKSPLLAELNAPDAISRQLERTPMAVIYGHDEPDGTLQLIKVTDPRESADARWADGRPKHVNWSLGKREVTLGSGDGRVLSTSAQLPGALLMPLDALSHGEVAGSPDSDGTYDRQQSDRALETIAGLLGLGSTPHARAEGLRSSAADAGVFVVAAGSPVTVTMTDPEGQQIDETTGSQASQSFFARADDGGAILVSYPPSEGEYRVTLEGTEAGEYHIVGRYSTQDGRTASAAYVGNIEPKQIVNATFTISTSEEGTPTLELSRPLERDPSRTDTGIWGGWPDRGSIITLIVALGSSLFVGYIVTAHLRSEPRRRRGAGSNGKSAGVSRPAMLHRWSLKSNDLTYSLEGELVTLGRGPSVTLQLKDPQVSYTHAEITATAEYLLVRDLGSTNGTYVNGARIADVARLVEGDELRVGKTRLRVCRDVGAEESNLPHV